MIPILDTLLVRFKTWDEALIHEVASRYGAQVRIRMPEIRYATFLIDHTKVADLFQAVLADPDVDDVDIEHEATPHAVVAYHAASNDALLDWQHSHKRMNTFAAWKHALGSGSTVSICDSGMNLNQRLDPLFSGKSITHWNGPMDSDVIVEEGGGVTDITYDGSVSVPHLQHGLGCMCAAVADGMGDGEGPVGVAPKANLINMRQMQPGMLATGSGDIAASLLVSYNRFGAKIISCSYMTGVLTTGPSLWKGSVIASALDYLASNNVLVCFSAGNDNHAPETDGFWVYPAAYAAANGHLGVGCTSYEETDKPAAYTNHGSNANIVSPGHSSPSLYNFQWSASNSALAGKIPPGWTSRQPGMRYESNGGMVEKYRFFDGTSNAAPLVAGVAALVSSINPALTGPQIRSILLSTTDKGQNKHFYERFNAATGVVNALKAVLQTKALMSPGSLFPYVSFFGKGVSVSVSGGVATTNLRGVVQAEVTGVSTDAITGVELWAGDDLIYSGAPKTTWTSLVTFAAARVVGKQIRVVVRTAGATAEETYSDVVGYAISDVAPQTYSSPSGGTVPVGSLVTLTAVSDNPPVRISYRWNGGAWQTYSAPIVMQPGVLEFYGVDCVGNVEGGIDYALT